MKHPSKRTHKIAEVEQKRLAAFHANDHEAFKEHVLEIERLEATEDEFTCLSCGEDFSAGPHVDLLVAAVLVFGDDGVEQADYGILATEREENGRRLKFCAKCSSAWAIPVLEYCEMR